ncbi:MAG TPA: ferrochelatase [Paenalcaligenes sp.]|nr:ferrochelatase [Paenalcaligenes sp.]
MLLKKYRPEPYHEDFVRSESFAQTAPKVGVLLINLGTPDAPEPAAIRRYLAQFLSDPRVVELPPVLWQPILRTAVLGRRPQKLAPRYRSIWLSEGAPLLVYSEQQVSQLQQQLKEQGLSVPVALGMRYGSPSLQHGLDELRAQGCERILAVPLYPQYAASTTASAVDEVNRLLGELRRQPELRYINSFCAHQGYIEPLANHIRAYWQKHGQPERLLLSFHGIPKQSVVDGDPYHKECMHTRYALEQALADTGVPIFHSFQSRFGAAEWLKPYTEPLLKEWAAQGIKNIHVTCPGFIVDCLETLEEIDIDYRQVFLEAGGEQFGYIDCLNAQPEWIRGLANIVVQHLQGWI